MIPPGHEESPMATRTSKELAAKCGDDEPNQPHWGENAEHNPLHELAYGRIEEE
jgi:hypothetical protein